MSEPKTCAECGKPLLGRSDKKFCDDNCRSSFHNGIDSGSRNLMRNINYILRKNRRILAELNPNEKSKANKDKLLKLGFDFNYFTSIYKTKNGNVYYFVYEQGYLPLENHWFALVKKKEYIK